MSPSPPQPTASLPFIFVTLLLDMLGIGLIVPVLPTLVTQLSGGATNAATLYGALISAYALMQFLCAPLLGALSDAHGRRPILLLSLTGSTLGYLLMAFSPNLLWMLLARLIAGTTGANVTVANAYVADISTPATRARNFGVVSAAFGLGFIAGPALGGLLGNVDVRLPFLFAAGLAALNALYGLLVLPESHPVAARRPVRATHLNPFGGWRTLRAAPGVLGLTAAIVTANLAVQFSNSTWVLHGTARYGWTPGTNGLTLAGSGLLMAAVQLALLGPVVRRLGERRTATTALLIGVLSFLLYGLAAQPWLLYTGMLLGVLCGLAGPTTQSLFSARIPPEQQGAAQGALTGLNSLATVVGPLAATGLFAHYAAPGAAPHLPGIVFFACSALLLLSAGMLWATFRRASAPVRSGGAA
ncbi:TCR/Tet family MFS transporter [Deinococcus maricopensis]|uniref:Major facilitator superfamily MFS_1 n=1 Tax=Deinococcus maricopensis (strain DSM 21211 / LMG 22137 / NRRL B-23946 / LB-34) TaxID=709986 RepID=E8UAA3_DEIML|nr:tetracycline resistance MFS efflux pump [Deinococcus maricopensis]ADV67992.1 major facilitator superfamily MFS_1 [Deinococcus maricopensis DSM 21211]